MTYWFTSDLHFGHQNIIKFCNRPWWDLKSMNQGLVDRWNERVQDGDSVFVLGDLCWGPPAHFMRYLEQLKGIKFLVPGNHDQVWHGQKKPRGRTILESAGFKVMPAQATFWLEGTKPVLMCHFPYESVYDGDRRDFTEYMPKPMGDWLLHGHVHNLWTVDKEHKQLNVGVDVHNWYPINEEDVRGAMAA